MADLLLLFRVGQKRYALEAISVVEVIPRVNLSPVHQSPPYVVGQFNYQGQLVPVLDLSQCLGQQTSRAVLSTRIILVNLAKASSEKKLLGLMVEQVTDTLRHDQATPITASVSLSRPAYLGQKLVYDQDIIQCLCINQLLSTDAYDYMLTSQTIH